MKMKNTIFSITPWFKEPLFKTIFRTRTKTVIDTENPSEGGSLSFNIFLYLLMAGSSSLMFTFAKEIFSGKVKWDSYVPVIMTVLGLFIFIFPYYIISKGVKHVDTIITGTLPTTKYKWCYYFISSTILLFILMFLLNIIYNITFTNVYPHNYYILIQAPILFIIIVIIFEFIRRTIYFWRLKTINLFYNIRTLHNYSNRDNIYSAKLIHWSDLHCTPSCNHKTITGNPSPNSTLQHIINNTYFREYYKRNNINAILITGDITDSGRGEEWKEYFSLIKKVPSSTRIALVPGNHDLNITSRDRKTAIKDLTPLSWYISLIRFIISASQLQGSFSRIVDYNQLIILNNYLRENKIIIESFVKNPPIRTFLQSGTIAGTSAPDFREITSVEESNRFHKIGYIFNKMFPMVVNIANTNCHPLYVIILDSNYRSSNIATNAFGHINKIQLEKLKMILANIDGPYLIALHHHIILPPTINSFTALFYTNYNNFKNSMGLINIIVKSIINFINRRFMTIDNPIDLLEILPQDKIHYILHGHLHIGYQYNLLNQFKIFSSPSTSMGDELDPNAIAMPVYLIKYNKNQILEFNTHNCNNSTSFKYVTP